MLVFGGGSGTFSPTRPAVCNTPSGSKNFSALSFPYCIAVREITMLSESTFVTLALATCEAVIRIFSPSFSGSPPGKSIFTLLYLEIIENFPAGIFVSVGILLPAILFLEAN